MARANEQSEETTGNVRWERRGPFLFSAPDIYGTCVTLLGRPLDEIEPGQVNTRKRLVLDVPLLELFLRKPQVENLQAVLHLEIPKQTERKVQSSNTRTKKNIITDHEENTQSEGISPPTHSR